MKVKLNVDLEIPSIPNFLKIVSNRNNEEPQTISIKELSEEDLRAIGEEWTNELVKKALTNNTKEKR